MSQKLSYAIIGVGGVGGFIGIKLANAGHEVHFLAHSDYKHIAKHGLKLESYRGNIDLPKVNVYNNALDMPKCNVLLVCMKTTQNHLLPKILKDASDTHSVVLILQNGIGMETTVEKEIPNVKIAGGPIYICSHKIGPGHIHHLDIGNITLGDYNSGNNVLLKQVAEDLTQSDINTTVIDNLNTLRWQKLVWNVPFNGLSVVLNTTTDIIVNNTNTCRLCKDLMMEVITAANANDCNIDESFADKMIDLTKKMLPYAPSMKIDYDNHRDLEIEYIYTKLIQLAAKNGVRVPKIEMLEAQLKLINDRNKLNKI